MNTYICDKTLKKTQKNKICVSGVNTGAVIMLLTAAFCAYLLLHPHISPHAVYSALGFCLTTLIPSLFPMMVAGEILILSGFGELCAKSIGKVFQKLFGIRGEGAAAFALGCVCGYPVGGKTAISLYGEGRLTLPECELLCALSNNAGPGFVIAGIGAVMWGSTGFGVILYITEIISAVIAAVLMKRLFLPSLTSPQNENITIPSNERRRGFSEIFSTAVSSGVTAILKVCGFVVLFEILLTGVFSMIPDFPGIKLLTCIVSSALEITSGAVSTNNFALSGSNTAQIIGKVMTFALVGWGGLSAHMQLNSFAAEKGVVLKKYYLVKAMTAFIAALFGLLWTLVLPLIAY